jgi:DNA-binding transcriptional ArsR family regulator
MQDLVWRTALRLYADFGRAPLIAELATRTGLPPDKVSALLSELERRDLVGLDRESTQVRLAYPFTQAKTEHRVELNGQTLHALCAIDALGTGAMFGTDIAIKSQCRHCGRTVRVRTSDAGRALRSIEPPGSLVWYDFAYDGSAATSCCPSIVFFCSDFHLEQWRSAQASRRAGVRLAMDEALEVGRAIFGPVLVEPAVAD